MPLLREAALLYPARSSVDAISAQDDQSIPPAQVDINSDLGHARLHQANTLKSVCTLDSEVPAKHAGHGSSGAQAKRAVALVAEAQECLVNSKTKEPLEGRESVHDKKNQISICRTEMNK
ncbi:hypothetical protein N7489_011188 [Penicillium chrysogenum]|uniref:uncharacterized protein n=1 Tax=Penicillium chrysogenum TaxID=5076 RepID=UPI0024DF1003|nr:uncharacterized protein N7489_011188 [Penicillium chrysogenum]KAJ5230480.1 hypothetical protein N7489_011188 [Penicillium chrysogenum]